MSTKNKVVFVVGAGSGIGLMTVEKLLQKSCRVIAADRSQEKLNGLRIQFSGSAANLKLVHLDITNNQQVRFELEEMKRNGSVLDAVVITAAVHATSPVEFLSDEMIDRVLEVNLTAHIKFVRDVLPFTKEGGRIIALSSIAAGVGIPMSSLYSASKAGLEMFYETLNVELTHRRIKCIIVQPGNVDTGFNETGNEYRPRGVAFLDEGYKRVLEKIHSRNGMPASAVAQAVIHAIETPSPSFCYVVGMNARKAHWAKRLLGRDLTLKVMAKYFGF